MRVVAQAEVIDLQEVLTNHLGADCQPIVRKTRQLDARLRDVIDLPRHRRGDIDEQPVIEHVPAVARPEGYPTFAGDHVAGLDVEAVRG